MPMNFILLSKGIRIKIWKETTSKSVWDNLEVWDLGRLDLDQFGKSDDNTTWQGNCKFTFLNFKKILR